MKKLLFAVSALAALSLLAPSTGMAQVINHMSLFADEEATINHVTMTPFAQMDLYLVILNPYNEHLDQPITFLAGVEFAFPAPTNAVILSLGWPVDVTDVGTGGSHIAGFGQPLAVTDELATVCTATVLYSSATSDPAYFTLAPAEPASAPGFMAVLDSADEGEIIPVNPLYDNFDYNVFAINDVVATVHTTMDAVKALYR